MNEVLEQLQLLTGQTSHLEKHFDENIKIKDVKESEIGISALNELLLSAGFDTVGEAYFALLYLGEPVKYEDDMHISGVYKDGMRIIGIDDLRKKVEKMRIYGALKYGNFKYAYKKWALMEYEEIADELDDFIPRRKTYFSERTNPLEGIEYIETDDTPFLGYISGETDISELDSELEEKIDKAKKLGESNLLKYLTFNHMDVYVATSMRLYRDYLAVSKFINKVFSHPDIVRLKIRYFNPTQVYSSERICKSLIESLMLKRAKCTIYCAQETETLGKDSELAATLAQGKPVIVYVPKIDNTDEFEEEIIENSKKENPKNPINPLRLYLVTNFPKKTMLEPDLLKVDDINKIAHVLAIQYKEYYEDKAKLLNKIHPLAIQVDLNTGVANGVLVVRDENQCAEVLSNILEQRMEFYFEEQESWNPDLACGDYLKTYILREKITRSPYRVVIGDALLTNSFWNFYLE